MIISISVFVIVLMCEYKKCVDNVHISLGHVEKTKDKQVVRIKSHWEQIYKYLFYPRNQIKQLTIMDMLGIVIHNCGCFARVKTYTFF